MSLLTRAAQKIFGLTGGASEFGQIGSKVAGAPVTTKNLETMQSLPEYDLGLNAIVSDQGASVLPYLEDINSLFFLTTSQLAYLMQAGVPEWDDTTEYYEDISLVLYDGNIWIDKYGTPGTPNLNFNPATNLDKWRSVTTDAALVDSGAANAYILTPLAGTIASSYYDGLKVTFKAGNSSTIDAPTVDVSSLGAKTITDSNGNTLLGNAILADDYVTLIYNLAFDRFELQTGRLKSMFVPFTFGTGASNARSGYAAVYDMDVITDTCNATGVLPEDFKKIRKVFLCWNGVGAGTYQPGIKVQISSDNESEITTTSTSTTLNLSYSDGKTFKREMLATAFDSANAGDSFGIQGFLNSYTSGGAGFTGVMIEYY